jgi:ribonuclease BN (tRNA processing enzyme)
MNIKVLGAHNIASQDTKHISLLIDDILAIDAGNLVSGLTFSALQELKAILLTHYHYDHMRDIPSVGMSLSFYNGSIEIYSTQIVCDAMIASLKNGNFYPNLLEEPPENPVIKFRVIEPKKVEQIAGYSVLAVPVNHMVPTVGYQVTAKDGKKVFYTSDTGRGLADCWQQVSPNLLIIEVSFPNGYEDFVRQPGHLTPSLLRQELKDFQRLKGYLPSVLTVHMTPSKEEIIESEIAALAEELNASIALAREGMQVSL